MYELTQPSVEEKQMLEEFHDLVSEFDLYDLAISEQSGIDRFSPKLTFTEDEIVMIVSLLAKVYQSIPHPKLQGILEFATLLFGLKGCKSMLQGLLPTFKILREKIPTNIPNA